jgi:hypothetical protein
MALGPTQPPIQWVPGVLSLGVKRLGREADHLPPSSAEVKERVELHIHYPNTTSWRGDQIKHKDNFTLLYVTFLCFIKKLSVSRMFAYGQESHVWGVSRSFRTGYLERELQMVELCAARCCHIAIL